MCTFSETRKVCAPCGRKDEAWSSNSPLRKEAVISLPLCFVLSVKEFQKLQVAAHDLLFPSVAARQGEGGRVALNNTLAFMEAYQMFQE